MSCLCAHNETTEQDDAPGSGQPGLYAGAGTQVSGGGGDVRDGARSRGQGQLCTGQCYIQIIPAVIK